MSAVLEGFRLSPQQERLWAAELAGAGDRSRAVAVLRGASTELLRSALAELHARHEILRTTFNRLPGMDTPIQVVIEDAVEPALDEIDLAGLDTGERERRLEEILAEAVVFDLENGLAGRFRHLLFGGGESFLVADLPVLVADARSCRNLLAELVDLMAGEALEEPVQYVQFSEWQHEVPEEEDAGDGLELWRRQDLEADDLRLPLESPGEASDVRPGRVVRGLDARRRTALEALGLEDVLLAAWHVLLHRLGGTTVRTGVRREGRVYEEMEGALGLYESWPRVTSSPAPGVGFDVHLRRIAESLADVTEWQELYPLVAPPPSNEAIGFDLVETTAAWRRGEIEARLVELSSRTERFKLHLTADAGNDDLELCLHFDSGRFDAAEAERLLARLDTLLGAVAADPERAIGRLDLLSPAERAEVVAAGERLVPADAGGIMARFAEVVRRSPDVVAVEDGDGVLSLTFAEVASRARRLARLLRRHGVAPERRVALLMERSTALLTSILATLEAGGAYVPLDPDEPPARLGRMLRTAAPQLVLTRDAWAPVAREAGGSAAPPILVLDELDEELEHQDDAPLGVTVDVDHPAYAIFTSGSTGEPKAVVVRHGAALNLLAALRRTVYAGLEGPRRVSVNAPFTFDASVKQWLQLLDGHTLVLVPEAVRPDGEALLAFLERRRVEVFDATPAQFGLLAAAGFAERPPAALERLLLGGEAIGAATWRRLAALERPAVWNVYGPTEATVDALARPLAGAPEPELGEPLANVRRVLVDPRLEPVTWGAVGEIGLAGAGLARGYLGRPAATAAAFVPDPFSPDVPGARLYRTGDLARRLPDGRLLFAGRRDHQVKWRGFRVELGEIEAALLRQPEVREAAVLLHESDGGESRLVAYFAPRVGQAVTARELRDALARELPEALLPSLLVELETLPLTRHGKVDRAALPAPSEGAAADELPAPPQTPFEEMLAEIWCDVLELPAVGTDRSFFDVGGHSLVATRVMSRIRQVFQVDLPLRLLFETPVLRDLAARLEAEVGAGAAREGLEPLEHRPHDGTFRPSFAQERLWFLMRLEPDSAYYNSAGAVRLVGRLRRDELARALAEVVRRHETLRTAFDEVDGAPVARVEEAVELPWADLDLTALAPARRAAELDRAASRLARRPFDLRRAPLLRLALVELGEDEAGRRVAALVVVLHHIVSDAGSIEILLREVSALYAAFVEDRPSPLAELPVQYADFAVWQRRALAGDGDGDGDRDRGRDRDESPLDAQLAAWRERLDGADLHLDLPTDRPRPAVRRLAGATRHHRFRPELVARLRELGRRHGTTLFMTLLAGLDVWLGRLTGQGDFLVGSPVAGRTRPEIEGLVGFFVNTLALRAEVGPAATFAEVLGRVRATALAAYAHQDLPFERLVDAINPERSLGRTPLFQVMLAFQHGARDLLRLPEIESELLWVDAGTSRFDWTLIAVDEGEGLRGILEYSTDLFDATTMERFLRRFEAVLERAADDPEASFAALTALPRAEAHQVLVEWNDAGFAAPGGTADATADATATIHSSVLAQAARTPGAAAVLAAGESLTYAELEERSGRLARHLRRLGAAPGGRVAVALQRDLDLPVAILAVLRTGAAYLPLDPAYPRERLAFMIADAGAGIAVTTTSAGAFLPEDLRRVDLDRDPWRDETGDVADLPAAPVDPDHLAYVIYTSGSTGRPKGVAISHQSAAAFLAFTREAFRDAETAGVLAATSVCFDLSIFELFAPLVRGGTVILAENALALADLAEAERVTLVNTVPSAMAELLRLDALPASLRTVNLAGEALKRAFVDTLLADPRVGRLCNLYGPSEDTTYTTWTELRRGEMGAVPIGRPLPGTRIFLLDAELRPVPLGVPGEIGITSASLARGYLGRPARTAASFVPSPVAVAPGERLYRTGDLGRLRRDGSLDFLGRFDHQIKLRGFRVELGEIESLLTDLDVLKETGGDAVAVLGETAAGDPSLLAYVEAPAGTSPDALRDALAERLPASLLPNRVIVLESLPRTPNGKIDRAALPDPETGAGEGRREVFASATEEVVAAVWSELLATPVTSRDDDFFARGGHSLLAVRVLARLGDVFGTPPPVRALFEAPTVAGLARRIDAARGGQAGDRSLPPLESLPEDAETPLSFAQERLVFLDRLHPGDRSYILPLAFEIDGPLEPEILHRALESLVARHEALRTVAVLDGGESRAEILSGSPLEWSVDSVADGEDLEHLTRPFDLARGPLVRARLTGSGERHRLLLAVHHMAVDAVSLEILGRELVTVHAALAAGETPALAAPGTRYAEAAAWQRRGQDEAAVAAGLSAWRERFPAPPETLHLPLDRPRPPAVDPAGGVAVAHLDDEVVAGLRQLGSRHGATFFMTLAALFEGWLHRLSGQERFAVGTPVAGRPLPELSEVVGLFVNTVALAADLRADPTCEELLGRVRRDALAAFAHEDLPFERLVEAVDPERDLAQSPLFQVMLILQPAALCPREEGGVTFTPRPVDAGATKFDLTLAVLEGEEGVELHLAYQAALFDASTVRRWLDFFVRLAAGAVADPRRPVGELPFLSPAERQQLAREWHGRPPVDTPSAVRPEPDGVALVEAGRRLTFGELEACSHRLAQELRRRGAGRETVVAILAERAIETVVAILAVLDAGAAWVTLGADDPRERVEGILEETGALALLARPGRRQDLMSVPRLELTPEFLVPSAELPSGEPASAKIQLTDRPAPESLAYVLYTSGSTGRPKGVQVSRAALDFYLDWAAAAYEPATGAGAPLHSPLTFDLVLTSLLLPLRWGRPVTIVPEGAGIEPLAAALAAAEDWSFVKLTPSHLDLLARRLPDAPRRMRQAIVGGEALETARLEAWRGTPVWNEYGPTEATVGCVVRRIVDVEAEAPPAAAFGQVPIGRPIPGVRLAVVDRRLRPVPPGSTGELLIGGPGLARGYLDRPAKTAESFVPDAFGERPGERLYRTGDLVRALPDGELVYLGRRDRQIKVRGVRIEPGEIEAALLERPGIEGATALVRDGQLIAYAGAPGGGVDGEDLRAALRERLPAAMVPARIVVLERLPLAASGKVDRAALPAPALVRSAEGEVPASLAEELVAGLFAELLLVGQAGRDDDFFALGGHSLLALKLQARIARAVDVELPLAEIFAAPTVRELARRIDAAAFPAPSAPPLEAVPRDELPADFPLSFAQERVWVLARLEPDSPFYNSPAGLLLDGPLDPAALEAALGALAERHEVLRTTFPLVGDEPVQRVFPPRRVPLPLVDLAELAAPRETAERLAEAEVRRPFDLVRGPLFRAKLLRLAPERHLIVMTLHHIISDAWSMAILLRDVAELYAAASSGSSSGSSSISSSGSSPRAPSSLPALTVQVADVARWQREWLTEDTLAGDLVAWRTKLEPLPPPLEIPADRPLPAVRSFRGGRRELHLDAERVAALRRLGGEEGATLFMTLLTAYHALFFLYSHQEDMVIGTPHANRRRVETEELVGFFVNLLPLRTRLDGDPTLRQLLGRVRATTLAAYEHQDLPFERLVDELQVPREASRNPLVQVLLVLQNVAPRTAHLEGLSMTPVLTDTGTANFDLVLALAERGDGGLGGTFFYSADLFESETVAQLAEHYHRVLELFVAAPDLALSELTERLHRELAPRADAVPDLERFDDDFNF